MEIRLWQIRLLSRKLERGVDCHLGWLADGAAQDALARFSKDDPASQSQRSLARTNCLAKEEGGSL